MFFRLVTDFALYTKSRMANGGIGKLNTKSAFHFELVLLLIINGLLPSAALAAETTSSSVGRVIGPHNANQFRAGGISAAGTRTSGVRTREQVRSTRTAHGKARLDHVHNRMSSLGLKTQGSAINPSKATFQARLTNMSSVQHLMITAGHDNGKDKKDDDKSSQSQASDHDDSSEHGDGNSHNQIAQGSHSETQHMQTSHEEKRKNEHHEKERRHERVRKEKKEKEKRGFFHRIRHAPNADTSDANGGQSANQGIGDGSNVGLNAADTIDELHNNIRTITLHEGTAFVAHDKPVCVKTNHGEVRIAPHTAVYVVSLGRSVGVYDIADRKTNDVVIITHGKKSVDMKAGEQVLLTDKENKEFEKANPAPEIHTSRMKELGDDLQTKIFHAEFSPLAALDHAEGFHNLVNSNNKQDRALADHILKTAAVVLHLRSSDQP